ncbi:nucleoside triphosphate pyrophosphohydrolase family protein [Candidatus Woesearchaeota archaeon]|nr:nucleoside triphosphate pyrophosphohydrolase family protein [Candidatus Woesearchaeota archaeon]
MNFDHYQQESKKTAIYPKDIGLYYVVMGLCGEAGEIANKTKKLARDHGGVLTEDMRNSIIHEAQDCLWYLAQLCTELNYPLALAAEENLKKLADRQARGVLGGSGDAR